MEFVSNSIANYLAKQNNLEKNELEKINYVLKVIISDISKLIILLGLFALMNSFKPLVFATITLWLIRTFTGGIHLKSYFSCLGFSFGFFASVILLNNNMPLNSYLLSILFITNITLILLFSPMKSATRPTVPKRKKLVFRIISVLVIIVHFVGVMFFNESPYFNISIWVITLQSFQIIIGKVCINHEKAQFKQKSVKYSS